MDKMCDLLVIWCEIVWQGGLRGAEMVRLMVRLAARTGSGIGSCHGGKSDSFITRSIFPGYL